MFKKLIIIVVILGFLTNTVIYIKSSEFQRSSDAGGWLCPGIPYDAGSGFLNGGFPLQSHRQTEIYGTCGDISNKLNLKEFADILKTWQFYANWIIWSLPFLATSYFIGKKHANYRH